MGFMAPEELKYVYVYLMTQFISRGQIVVADKRGTGTVLSLSLTLFILSQWLFIYHHHHHHQFYFRHLAHIHIKHTAKHTHKKHTNHANTGKTQ